MFQIQKWVLKRKPFRKPLYPERVTQTHLYTLMVCALTVALSPEQKGTVMSDHLELLIAYTGHCRDGGRWYDPL